MNSRSGISERLRSVDGHAEDDSGSCTDVIKPRHHLTPASAVDGTGATHNLVPKWGFFVSYDQGLFDKGNHGRHQSWSITLFDITFSFNLAYQLNS